MKEIASLLFPQIPQQQGGLLVLQATTLALDEAPNFLVCVDEDGTGQKRKGG
jgi:hypothetical protein